MLSPKKKKEKEGEEEEEESRLYISGGSRADAESADGKTVVAATLAGQEASRTDAAAPDRAPFPLFRKSSGCSSCTFSNGRGAVWFNFYWCLIEAVKACTHVSGEGGGMCYLRHD